MLVAPSFFGYYRDIEKELESRGYVVDYITDRPSESVAFKSLGRINYRIVQRSIESHFRKTRELLAVGEYDFVLFVGGMSICFSRRQMEELRSACSAVFGLYLWDALSNCQRVGNYVDLFDFAFSFEPNDCKRENMRFLPLFYVNDYEQIPACPSEGFEYDACFIGSVHQISKFENIRRIVTELEKEGARVYCHYYMPSRTAAILRKASHSIYRDVDLKFKPLRRQAVTQIYSLSKTVIDSPQAGQNGLTMRSIETLGAKRRLITANAAIKNYDFYQFGNVLVCEDERPLDALFAKSNPVDIPDNIRQSYSVSAWLDQLLTVME